MCRSITQKLRTRVQQQFHNLEVSGSIGPAFLELWRHNLFVADEDASPLIVGYTTESSYASVVFECVFKTKFERHNRPILVVPEIVLRLHYANTPDVFIFSVFDADCEPIANSGCAEMIAYYIQEYHEQSKLMMISGEAINTKDLDERVSLLSSVSSVSRRQHVYLPVVSISFAERLQNSPIELLSPVATSLIEPSERRFCAYLYARCDRLNREYMFDLLNAMEPVDALGMCAGSLRPPDKSYKPSRYSKWFNDEAVMSYKRYKFVVAFENSAEPGYVTEKLVNPLLAGSIPVYSGNSTTASQLFNPGSFIDCGRFENLENCASFVLQVHKSPELYDRIRREPPIRNITLFNEVFSWHPSISSRDLTDKVAKMLH
ncbi:putative alpha mannosyltransferase [Phytophthora infestans T30-4]|uniref:Fucosyltransferase n=1 Tax=Phytophthora infestans (strain T30-4) TaxID=403677 RepID=D0N4H8_PHYIT|nr:putative alpha mannosyltransferase [Phytophthora infestans T30-4]EEY69786.1 putative alpha mannosyltransferase [Phytophthora infestans T30-4]|eukprot:XP_002998433.1 putative alpha mannosyltransferase [Phytophthora infestans T30-4]